MSDYTLPADRANTWTAGTHTGVLNRFVPTGGVFNVVDYGADMTGAEDSTAALASAIGAAKNAGGIAYVPAGTLSFNGIGTGLSWNNWTLRGAGKSLTTLKYNGGSIGALSIGTGSSFNYPEANNTITAGFARGSTQVTIGVTSDFNVGMIIRLRWNYDTDTARLAAGASPPAFEPTGGGGYGASTHVLTAKTSSTLTFWPPIHQEVHSSVTASVMLSQWPTSGVALEDFTLSCEGNTSVIFPIAFNDCYNCSIKNVKSYKTNNYHFFLTGCCNCEIINCDFQDRNGSGSNGAGILFGVTSNCLIEGNLGLNVFPIIEINQSSHGNVFAYNCFEGSTTNTNHGPYNRYNLYERNIIRSLQSDGYFGGEGEQTQFANWLHGTTLNFADQSFVVSLNRLNRKTTFINNLLGNSARNGAANFSFGNPNLGNGSYVGTASPLTGDWWYDWDQTNNRVKRWNGTMTTRTDDYNGTVTLDPGQETDFNGSLTAAGGSTQRTMTNASVVYCTPSSGNVTTVSNANGSLPAIGAAVTITPGMGGFQESDLDVERTCTRLANKYWETNGSAYYDGENPGSTTFPASYYRSSAPSWWPTSLNWPPAYNPSLTHAQNYALNPAGYRLVNGTDAPSGSPTVPSIITQPSNQTVNAQTNATFFVVVAGNPTPTFQWRKNGTNINGATSGTLVLPTVEDADEGTYTCVATNSQGSATSDGATLTVNAGSLDVTPPTPDPSTAPTVTVYSGSQITVVAATATDTDSPPVQYNHSIGGVYQGWQSSPTKVFTGLTPSTLYSFKVKTRDQAYNETAESSAVTATTSPGYIVVLSAPPLPSRASVAFTLAGF